MGIKPTPVFPPLLGASQREEVEQQQSASPPPMSSCGHYIMHCVCRFDTLAGVAIQYGVEIYTWAFVYQRNMGMGYILVLHIVMKMGHPFTR